MAFPSNDSFIHCSIYVFYTPFFITDFLLLIPLCILVLFLGFQRWRQQRSGAALTSHSDIFTYNMVVMEMIGVVGSGLFCWGDYRKNNIIFHVGIGFLAVISYGGMFFHVLTCVERYLAVVHPITYMSLRGERGVRIRNICIGCVWLLTFGAATVMTIVNGSMLFMDLCLLISSLIITCFCSLSVLCVLIRPGPGEQGGDRERVDQSKQRAFYTIVAILVVLLLKCFANLALTVHLLKGGKDCAEGLFEVWMNLPSSLVLPLLFLHRAGIFTCCKNNNK